MKVGIDCRWLDRSPSGIQTYVQNLTERIPSLECLQGKAPRNNLLWQSLRVPLAQLRKGWDAYHAPAYTAPLIGFSPLVLTVHDVSYLVSPDFYPYPIDRMRLWYYRASIRAADWVIVPSHFSMQELIKFFPEKADTVRVIAMGVSGLFEPDEEAAREAREKYGLPERFFLHVGDLHPRRNIGLMEEVARDRGWPVVFVGRVLDSRSQPNLNALCLSGLSSRELKGLYSAATIFLYLSEYEGFGLPVLEAMRCGLPVVAALRGSLPEVCGEAAILVEELRVESVAAAVTEACSRSDDLRVRGLARAAAFSWDETARKTVEVYQLAADV